jgi:hypothetical protein
MVKDSWNDIFTADVLAFLFPKDRANQFFDALFGDPSEGAYDIQLAYKGYNPPALQFEMQMVQRPGKCLACHLTYGLPQVFSRHPVINIKGLVAEIGKLIGAKATIADWRLGATREHSRNLHVIPLTISLAG